jgi:hypothetical protein
VILHRIRLELVKALITSREIMPLGMKWKRSEATGPRGPSDLDRVNANRTPAAEIAWSASALFPAPEQEPRLDQKAQVCCFSGTCQNHRICYAGQELTLSLSLLLSKVEPRQESSALWALNGELHRQVLLRSTGTGQQVQSDGVTIKLWGGPSRPAHLSLPAASFSPGAFTHDGSIRLSANSPPSDRVARCTAPNRLHAE